MGKVFDQRVEHMPWLQGAFCTILVQLKILALEVYQMLPHNFDNIQCDGDLIFYRRGGQSGRKPPLLVWDSRRGYFTARAQLSDVEPCKPLDPEMDFPMAYIAKGN